MNRRRLFYSAGVLTILLAGACSDKAAPKVDEHVPVTVATAAKQDVPISVESVGTVLPRSTVAVRALVGGELTAVHFKEGDNVRKGDVLFSIDERPYRAALAQAEANMQKDLAQLHNNEQEAARYETLVKKDFVTKEDYDRVTSSSEAAKAVVAADKAAVDTAQLDLSYCTIRAPIDGRTGSLQVHLGNLVKPNDTTPLIVLNQIAPIDVSFSIPQRSLASVGTAGHSFAVNLVSPDTGATIAQGHLSFVDNAIDPATGTISMKGEFDNKDLRLWPGEFVHVNLVTGVHSGAVVIPAQAVQSGQRGQFVYVVRDDAVEMRIVSIGDTVGNLALITSGVAPGEQVVTDGQIRLTPQSKVSVRSGGHTGATS